MSTFTASRAVAIALLVCVGGCGSSSGSVQSDEETTYASGDEESETGGFLYSADYGDDQSKPEFDEDAARSDAEQEVADEGYSGPCTIDCSGHDAGFNWAADGHEDYGISRSRSFDEGQIAYEDAVEERLEEKRQQFEDDPSGSDYAE